MPLIINGEAMGKSPSSLGDFMQDYPLFKDSSSKLCSQNKVIVGPAQLLYIGQREMGATCPKDDVITMLGSEDATTCHIVILRDSGSRATCLAHLDGCSTGIAIKDMVQLVEELSPGQQYSRLELSLIGGFTDDRGSSEELSISILDTFNCLPQDIHLVTACITDMNTEKRNGIPWPVIYGIAVNVKSGEIVPATFPDKGPDLALRSARHFSGGDEVLNIYDAASHQLVIGPFHYDIMRHVDRWCQAPDAFIRKYLSTSPEQEPEGFESSVRAALTQIRDFPDPLKSVFKNGRSRSYRKEASGEWSLI